MAGIADGNPPIEPLKTAYTTYQGALLPMALNLNDYIKAYMPAKNRLTVQQAADITAYAATLPSAIRGKALYESAVHGCATCHGVDGSGGLSAIGLSSALLIDPENGSGYLTIEGIAEKIVVSMPQTRTNYKNKPLNTTFGSCDQACANDIAKYIWTTFP